MKTITLMLKSFFDKLCSLEVLVDVTQLPLPIIHLFEVLIKTRGKFVKFFSNVKSNYLNS